MARGRRQAASEEGNEAAGMSRWLLTYSDMITLLLALFIILFAMSTINIRKFQALELGLKEAFNPKPGILHDSNKLLKEPKLVQSHHKQVSTGTQKASPSTAQSSHGNPPPPGAAQAGAQPLSVVSQRVETALIKAGLLNQGITVTPEKRGVVIRVLDDQIFFGTDVANLNAIGAHVVDVVGGVVRTFTNNVVVEGYADSQPIYGGPYPNNYALSAMRAVNVVERLVHADQIPESQLSSQGFGSTYPVAPNTSSQNMALNRRVNIVILAPGESRL